MLYVNVLVKDFKHLSVYLGIYPREIKTCWQTLIPECL